MGEEGTRTAFERALKVVSLIRDGKVSSNNHRGRLDIIADILGASEGGARKTHLMYRCNLSFRQMKSYSNFLIQRGFLFIIAKRDGENNAAFEVTDKGKKFLKVYKGLKSLMQ